MGSAIDNAYRHCVRMARAHYENFPVASYALPRRLRRPVAVIYAFARSADDLADEGDLSDKQRLDALTEMQAKLGQLRDGQPVDDPIFMALADVVAKHRLPWEPFEHLLLAFRSDVTKTRYRDFGEVMEYCRHSANPVGRLLLHLFDCATPRNVGHSDAICSALQLINFLQDIAQDYDENDRLYLPQDEMARFRVTEEHIADQTSDPWLRALVDFQIQRARRLLLAGAPLGRMLTGRAGLEIRLIVAGGMRILDKLSASRDQVFSRPRLDTRDKLWVLWKAIQAK